MSDPSIQPRILIVTPEIIYIPGSKSLISGYIKSPTVGISEYLLGLIDDLHELAVEVHVAQPDYRRVFAALSRKKQRALDSKIPGRRVHLAKDRAFFYSNPIDSNHEWENIKISLTFQREVINQIVPWVQPDLIHCCDWMTGLIPAMAKELGIPCVFTVNKAYSAKSSLAYVEDRGIDAAAFWQHLFYDWFPTDYEETRRTNSLDFLLSGVLAADFVMTTTPVYLMDIVKGQNSFFEASLKLLLAQKWKAGCAFTVNHRGTVQLCIDLFERILQRPLVNPQNMNAGKLKKSGLKKTTYRRVFPDRKSRNTNAYGLPDAWEPAQAISP